jgi:hypothetical protein
VTKNGMNARLSQESICHHVVVEIKMTEDAVPDLGQLGEPSEPLLLEFSSLLCVEVKVTSSGTEAFRSWARQLPFRHTF